MRVDRGNAISMTGLRMPLLWLRIPPVWCRSGAVQELGRRDPQHTRRFRTRWEHHHTAVMYHQGGLIMFLLLGLGRCHDAGFMRAVPVLAL